MYWGDKNVIVSGGGQSGIGKSTFVANLGVSMAMRGRQVAVIDADTGPANLHTILGVSSQEKTLDDFLNNRVPDLAETLVDTAYPNLKMLCSASDVLSLAAPGYSKRKRLIQGIQKLRSGTVIFDIEAGTHQRATDFFSLAPIGIILIEPVPASLDIAFSFIKNLLVRGLLRRFYHDKETTAFIRKTVDQSGSKKSDNFAKLLHTLEKKAPGKITAYRQLFLEGLCRMFLVANSIKDPSQNKETEKFSRTVKRDLALDMEILGALPYEETMNEAIAGRVPFVIKHPDSGYAKGISEIIKRLEAMAPPADTKARKQVKFGK